MRHHLKYSACFCFTRTIGFKPDFSERWLPVAKQRYSRAKLQPVFSAPSCVMLFLFALPLRFSVSGNETYLPLLLLFNKPTKENVRPGGVWLLGFPEQVTPWPSLHSLQAKTVSTRGSWARMPKFTVLDNLVIYLLLHYKDKITTKQIIKNNFFKLPRTTTT